MPSSSFFLRSSTTFVSVLSLFSTSSVAAPSQFKARQSQQQSWNLDIDYFNNQGQSFFDQFTFFTGADPTHGFVNYVPRDKASQAGLYNSGTLISGGSNGQSARMDVDYTKRYDGNAAYYNVPGVGRPSVRLESNHIMNAGSLAIVDLNHMPASTCGSWPAFWALGANPWPDNGEVDIIEGWNQQANNFVSAHTNNVCKLQSGLGGMSGQIAASDCDTYYPEGQYNNDPNTINYTGCKVNTADSTASKSFGTGFNNAGGGVYAMLWKTTSISVYFWSRNEIPQDVSSGSPNPDSWTKAPIAVIGGNSCNIAQNFNSMHLIFDTTFCGDAADNAGTWSAPGGCKSQIRGNPTCSNYVGNNPSVFQNSYWDVKGLRVYKLGNKPATTTTTTTTTTKSSTTTTKTTTTTTTTKASTTTTTTTSKPATTTTTTTSKPASTTTTTTAGGSTTTTTTKSGSTTTTTTKSGTTTTTTTKSGTTTTTASGAATTTSTTTKAATTTTTAAGVTTTTTTTKSGTTTTTGAAATTTTTTKSGSVTTTTTKSDAARTTTSTVSATTSGNGGDPWAQWPTTAAPTTTGKPVTNGGGFYGSSGTWSEWTITTGSESTTCSQPQPTTTTSCSTWHKDIPGNPVTSTCSNAVVTPTPVCWVCDEDDDDTTSPVGSATWGSWAEPTSTPAAVTSTWASWSGDDNGDGNGGKGGLPTLVVTVSPSAGQTWATWSAEPTSTDPAQTWATWNGNGNGQPVEPASGSSTWATWNSQSTPVQAASSSWASWASQSTPVQAASSTWATWNGAGASSTPVAASTASSWASWSSGAAATGPKSPVATYAGGAGKTSAGVVGVMAGAVMAGAMLL